MKAKKEKPKKKVRVPRPLGITAHAKRYHQNPTPKTRELLIDQILNAYITNQWTKEDKITGLIRLYNLTEIANVIDSSEMELMRKLNKQLARVGKVVDEGMKDTARAVLERALFWALESKAQIDSQLGLLLRSQGKGYKAFISGEVNRLLAVNQNSTKPLLDILKLFQGNTMMVPFSPAGPTGLPNQSAEQGKQGAYLTVDSANKMIQNITPGELGGNASIEAKLLELGDIPETNPNLQGGDILRGQSLSKGGPQPIEPTADPEKRKEARRGIAEVLDAEAFVI